MTNDKCRRAMLLHYAGVEVDEIFSTLPDTGGESDYDKAHEALTAKFTKKTNLAYEIHKFREAVQGPKETIDDYHVRLRVLAETCEFADIDREINTQISLKCRSKRLRRRAFRETLTLSALLDAARAEEISVSQADAVENEGRVAAIAAGKQKFPARQSNQGRNRHGHGRDSSRGNPGNKSANPRFRHKPTHQSESGSQQKTCFKCGGPFPHKDEQCKAIGKRCHKCNGKDHLAKMCRSGKRKQGHANAVSTETHETEQAEFKPACTSSESAEETDPEYRMLFKGLLESFPFA